jgi:hypothetical protein
MRSAFLRPDSAWNDHSEFSNQQSHHYLSLLVVRKLEWPPMIAAYI